jgi:hypothetical protein
VVGVRPRLNAIEYSGRVGAGGKVKMNKNMFMAILFSIFYMMIHIIGSMIFHSMMYFTLNDKSSEVQKARKKVVSFFWEIALVYYIPLWITRLIRGVFDTIKTALKSDNKEKKEAEEEEAREWIITNGSDRLRKGLREGLIPVMMLVYYNERIKLEIGPEWRFISPSELLFCTEACNPTEHELNVLANVKERWTDAEIDFLNPELEIKLYRFTASEISIILMRVPSNTKIMAALFFFGGKNDA